MKKRLSNNIPLETKCTRNYFCPKQNKNVSLYQKFNPLTNTPVFGEFCKDSECKDTTCGYTQLGD